MHARGQPEPAREESSQSFAALIARGNHNAPALTAPGREALAYGELEAQMACVSAFLRRHGLGRRDAVALALENGPEAAAAFLGVAEAAVAVVLCDAVGAGPMVTSAELERLRRLNFGIRALDRPVDVDWLVTQVRRYDAADAADVSRRIRATAGFDAVVDQILAVYEDALAEWRTGLRPSIEEEAAAVSAYLQWLARQFRGAALARAECAHLRSELGRIRATRTWRLHEQVLRWPGVLRAYRAVRRVPPWLPTGLEP